MLKATWQQLKIFCRAITQGWLTIGRLRIGSGWAGRWWLSCPPPWSHRLFPTMMIAPLLKTLMWLRDNDGQLLAEFHCCWCYWASSSRDITPMTNGPVALSTSEILIKFLAISLLGIQLAIVQSVGQLMCNIWVIKVPGSEILEGMGHPPPPQMAITNTRRKTWGTQCP